MGVVYRQKGRSTWMLKYYRDGRAIYESSGTDIKDDAKDILKKREAAIVDGLPVSNRTAKLRFDEAVQDVLNDYAANQRKSFEDVERRIDLHLTPFFGGRRMATITTLDIRAYIAARLEKQASPASINRELAIVKRAFSLAIKAATLLVKPHIPMLEERNVRQGFFEREAFEAVRSHLPPALRPLVTFAYLTGWRIPSEVQTLQWRQVDLKVKIIRLEPDTTKNAAGRTFPYGVLPELVTLMDEQKAEHDRLREQQTICPWVFHRDGEPVKWFYDAWKAACKEAGVPGRIPHDFRRTAVRNLVRAGVAEKTAMQLTGHKTRSVFDRYDIVNEEDLRAAVSRLAAYTPDALRRKG
jgi:integrase